MPKPDATFKYGPCSAAIFTNEHLRGNEIVRFRTVSFQRRYQDRNGEWKSTSSLGVNDIPKAILALEAAYAYLTESPRFDGGNTESGSEPISQGDTTLSCPVDDSAEDDEPPF